MTKADAIAALIASMQAGEPRYFDVGVVGYFIEGTPFSADGLSVDAGNAELRATEEGFTCEAVFPASTLSERNRRARAYGATGAR